MGDDNSKEPSACLREEHDKEEDRQRMEEHSIIFNIGRLLISITNAAIIDTLLIYAARRL